MDLLSFHPLASPPTAPSWRTPAPCAFLTTNKLHPFSPPPRNFPPPLVASLHQPPSLHPQSSLRHSVHGSPPGSIRSLEEQAEAEQEEEEEEAAAAKEISARPCCPVPDFSTSSRRVTLVNPCASLPASSLHDLERIVRPLMVYAPGMDCTGQGIRNQLPQLVAAGYDVRCIYIPSNDRSSWEQLVKFLIPLLKEAQVAKGVKRHVTLLGESFGGPLVLRLVQAAPNIISRLVLVNPATNFQESNPFVSLCASSGLLATFPGPLYKVAQDILLPLMVNRNRVSKKENEEMLSPIDYVPAACAAWRFSLLNDNIGLSDEDLRSIMVPTLVLSAAEDHVLSSISEGGRLQRLIPNAKRIILPHSGHSVLLEDSTNLAFIMEANGFQPPKQLLDMPPSTSSLETPLLLRKSDDGVTDDVLDEMGRLLEPWRILTSPFVSGENNLPTPEAKAMRPLLFVGNHTMFGVYDTPILFYELFLRGFRCRGLAHPSHWIVGVGPIFERYGHVKATKFAAYRLLKEGESVLLFPGGAREVCKRKGEKYKLVWKPSTDFVRMASRFNAIIIPFGALGGDDAYKILWDANEMLESPIGPLLREIYTRLNISLDYIYPITAFPGTIVPSLLALPSIERIYFHFGEPIDTATYNCNVNNRDKYDAMYLLVKKRVEASIDLLKQVRSKDPERFLPQRLLGKVLQLLPEFNRT